MWRCYGPHIPCNSTHCETITYDPSLTLLQITPVMHYPLTATGEMDQMQFVHFLKNVGLAAGVLVLFESASSAPAPKPAATKSKKRN